MSKIQDLDLGAHQGRRRVLFLEESDTGIVAVAVAGGATVTSQDLYAPGFSHFAGRLVATTALATTLEIRIQPRPGGAGLFSDDQFLVATIATIAVAAPRRYVFYWGEARAVLVGATAGSTFVFSSVFRVVIENTGANAATSTSIEGIECS